MYGEIGKPVLLYEGWLEDLREAGTTSDFPTYLEDKLHRRFLKSFREVEPAWMRYSYIQNVPDFREMTSVGLGEFSDLLPIPEDGEYTDMPLPEYTGPKIQLGTFGRSFSLGRRVIINDELNKMNDIPRRLARAARRTLAKKVVAIIAGNATAYDGTALFHASHNNLGSTAFDEASLPTAINKLRLQTDQNSLRIDLKAEYLLHPIELKFTVDRVLNGTMIPNAGTGATAAYGQTEYHAMRAILTPIEDPYFTDATDWYVITSPDQETATVSVGFLNGKQEPDLLLKDPGMRSVMGAGSDPYSFHFDKIEYKVRHDWATAPGEWRGGVKHVVA